jgi:hypothetical protein
LADRLIVPEIDQSNRKFVLVEGEVDKQTVKDIVANAKT